jgi:ABC-type polysaccharide/polyol phosphate export permease
MNVATAEVANRPPRERLSQVWAYRGLVSNYTKRETRSRFMGSRFGWLWSLISPLTSLAVYTVVFGMFLGADRGVTSSANGSRNFAVYLFTGLVTWNIFSGVLVRSVDGLLDVGQLRRKVAFPVAAPLLGMAAAVVVERSAEVALLAVVYVAIGNVGPTLLAVPLLVVMTAAFALGVALAVSVLNVRFRDISHLLQVFLQLVFYATPIIYPAAFVARRLGENTLVFQIFEANPLAQFVAAFRDVMWDLRLPSLGTSAVLLAWTVCSLTVGWIVFSRRAYQVGEEL